MIAIVEAFKQTLDAPGRMALQTIHLPLHHRLAFAIHQPLQGIHTRLIGSHLGLQISQQFDRIAWRGSDACTDLLPEPVVDSTIANEQEVAQQQTLLVNAMAEGGHRPWRDATHISVMAAAGYKEAGCRTRHRTPE